MSTASIDIATPAVTAKGWTRVLGPLGGLAIVAGLITLFVTPAGEDTGETPAEVVAYASSHESWSIAVGLFALASLVLGGAFVAALHTRLAGIATANESTLVLIGGLVFVLCFVLCWVIWTAPLVDMPDDPARALSQAEAYLGIDDVALVPARWRGHRSRDHGRAGVARGDARRAPGLARLAGRRRGDRVARDRRLLRDLRLDGVDRGSVHRDARRAPRVGEPAGGEGGAGPAPPSPSSRETPAPAQAPSEARRKRRRLPRATATMSSVDQPRRSSPARRFG